MPTAALPWWRRTGPVVPLFWGFGLALIVPVWMGPHFPSEDALAHLAWTEVYRALGAADSAWHPFYARGVQWNTPNLAYFGLQYALGSVMEPHVAQRLILSGLVAAWVAATYVLSLELTGRVSVGAFASLLLIHSSWLYGGYLGFLTGVPVLLLALALVARVTSSSPARGRDFAALAALGAVAYYSHLVSAAVFLLLIGVAVPFLLGQPRRVAGLALAGVPAAALVASYLLLDSLGSGGMRWEPILKTLARFAGMAFFRGFAAPTPAFWLALAAFAVVVLVLCLDTARRYLAGRAAGARAAAGGAPPGRLVLALAGCLALLYVASPDGVGDGYNLKARFQLVMWAWLLPSLTYSGSRPSPAVVVGAVAALLAWQVAEFGKRARRFNASFDAIVARAAALTPGSTLARELDYPHASFDGSFIKVLAHAHEDFAYHCRCVLIDGYHPSTAFYWVRTLRGTEVRPTHIIRILQLPDSPVTVTVEDGARWKRGAE